MIIKADNKNAVRYLILVATAHARIVASIHNTVLKSYFLTSLYLNNDTTNIFTPHETSHFFRRLKFFMNEFENITVLAAPHPSS